MMASKTKAHGKYRNKLGEIVPGVTTIVGLYDDGKSGALAHAAWKIGIEGNDYREVWNKKRDAGTLCHYFIDCDNKGIELDKEYVNEFPQDVIGKAETGFLGYLDWKKLNVSEVLASEIPLVDEELGYGGMLDMPYINKQGKFIIADHKTGRVYDSMKIQFAAYGNLWLVNKGNLPDGKEILQIDNEEGLVTVIPIGDSTLYFELFKHLLRVYQIQKEVGTGNGW